MILVLDDAPRVDKNYHLRCHRVPLSKRQVEGVWRSEIWTLLLNTHLPPSAFESPHLAGSLEMELSPVALLPFGYIRKVRFLTTSSMTFCSGAFEPERSVDYFRKM